MILAICDSSDSERALTKRNICTGMLGGIMRLKSIAKNALGTGHSVSKNAYQDSKMLLTHCPALSAT